MNFRIELVSPSADSRPERFRLAAIMALSVLLLIVPRVHADSEFSGSCLLDYSQLVKDLSALYGSQDGLFVSCFVRAEGRNGMFYLPGFPQNTFDVDVYRDGVKMSEEELHAEWNLQDYDGLYEPTTYEGPELRLEPGESGSFTMRLRRQNGETFDEADYLLELILRQDALVDLQGRWFSGRATPIGTRFSIRSREGDDVGYRYDYQEALRSEREGRHEDAILRYQSLEASDPERDESWKTRRARILAKEGRYEETVALVKELEAREGKLGRLQKWLLAKAHLAMGAEGEAARVLGDAATAEAMELMRRQIAATRQNEDEALSHEKK